MEEAEALVETFKRRGASAQRVFSIYGKKPISLTDLRAVAPSSSQ